MYEQNIEDQIQSVEVSIESAKEAVEKRKSVHRLTKNKDFKRIVLDGYFEKEAIRLVLLKADPNFQTTESQADLIKQMDSVGAFRNYLHTLIQLGEMSARALEEDEETLADLRSEA
jgi:hypothetical protein